MIDASDVHSLFIDASQRGERYIVELTLEALEHGIGCDAWARCESIISAEDFRKRRNTTPIRYRLTDLPIPYRPTTPAAEVAA